MTTLHSETDPHDDSLKFDEVTATQMLSDSPPDTLNESKFCLQYFKNSVIRDDNVASERPSNGPQHEV